MPLRKTKKSDDFESIDIDEIEPVEAAIEETTSNEPEEPQDNVVYTQDPIAEDKPKRKKRTRKPKIKKESKPTTPEVVERPDAVHPNHWRIAMLSAKRYRINRGED